MNFGDILDQWERQKRHAWPPSLERLSPREEWLKDKGDTADIDAHAGRAGADSARRRLNGKPDAVLDLHSLSQEEAWKALDEFFRAGQQQGLDRVLVIHGKGNHSDTGGVLKELTRKFIEACPWAGKSGRAPSAQGGSGATWVLLKKH